MAEDIPQHKSASIDVNEVGTNSPSRQPLDQEVNDKISANSEPESPRKTKSNKLDDV
jgi:hypothetical protein